MPQEFTLPHSSFTRLYRDLSFQGFFERYNPWNDGKARIATYSFNHKDFDCWAKFLPQSVFYINGNAHQRKYEKEALDFLKRYPWFEIYSVRNLHSKVVFFEQSGILLTGSENLYMPTSTFFEVMVEVFVDEASRAQICELLFGSLPKTLLFCIYDQQDIRLYKQDHFNEGLPFVPCNIEVDYWDLIANRLTLSSNQGDQGRGRSEIELHSLRRIYVILEYTFQDRKRYLALNRGYSYCGDLTSRAFKWLEENCHIEDIAEGYDGGHFPTYHPVPRDRRADRAIWLGRVKDHEKYEHLKVSVERVDITQRKIRKSDSIASDP